MQTFLPYPDMRKSLACLDYRRLGKQRLEARQLVNAIENGGAWSNHPAARMWRNYVDALKMYTNLAIVEWKNRGYKNTMELYDNLPAQIPLPHWYGDENFHASHRSNLLRKDPEYYGAFEWNEGPYLPYVWPI